MEKYYWHFDSAFVYDAIAHLNQKGHYLFSLYRQMEKKGIIFSRFVSAYKRPFCAYDTIDDQKGKGHY